MPHIPHPLKVHTVLDRIRLSEDGWLSLWDSQRPESRIEVKLDTSEGVENLIQGLAFEGQGLDGEGVVAESVSAAAELALSLDGDGSDWLHVQSPPNSQLKAQGQST